MEDSTVAPDTAARILAVAGWRNGVFDTGIVESAVLRAWLTRSGSSMDAEKVLSACDTLLRNEGLRLDIGAPRRLDDATCRALGVPPHSVSTRHQIDRRYQYALLERARIDAMQRMHESGALVPIDADTSVLRAHAHLVATVDVAPLANPPPLDSVLRADDDEAVVRSKCAFAVNMTRILHGIPLLPYEEAYVAYTETVTEEAIEASACEEECDEAK